MKIVCSSVCEVGKVRKVNQDALYSVHTDDWGIFVVADGMGGHDEGERASNEVIHAIRLWVEKTSGLKQMGTPEIVRQIKKVLSDSNNKIKNETSEGKLCGCTVVVMILIRQECILLTAGDSRCYELQGTAPDESLVQLTVDDVVGGDGPRKNYLTNAIGTKIPMICRSRVLPFQGTHTYLICTDGIYKYCDNKQLLTTLKKTRRGQVDEVLFELQNHVEMNGARDNYSALLIHAENESVDDKQER